MRENHRQDDNTEDEGHVEGGSRYSIRCGHREIWREVSFAAKILSKRNLQVVKTIVRRTPDTKVPMLLHCTCGSFDRNTDLCPSCGLDFGFCLLKCCFSE